MEEQVPDLNYYMKVAENQGISEETVRAELIDLIGETNSYLGAMKIFIKKLNSTKIEKLKGDLNK
jgi:hypothetical protein